MTLKAVARDFLPPVVTRTLKRAFGSIPKVDGDELMVWMGFVNPGAPVILIARNPNYCIRKKA